MSTSVPPVAQQPTPSTNGGTNGGVSSSPSEGVSGSTVPLAVDAPDLNNRPGPSAENNVTGLGLLADLEGTWVGSGFTLISLPAFNNVNQAAPALFRVQLNRTIETLTFSQIGGDVPNRGRTAATPVDSDSTPASVKVIGGQNDTKLRGLTYLQKVSDAKTNSALHIETGMWMSVPPAVSSVGTPADVGLTPQPAFTVARLGSIPHGDALLAEGAGLAVVGGPLINPVSSIPTFINGGTGTTGPVAGAGIPAALMGPFEQAKNPTPTVDFKPHYVDNMNMALIDAISDDVDAGNFVDTVVLFISSQDYTTQTGGKPLVTAALPATVPANFPGNRDPNSTVPVGTAIVIPTPNGSVSNLPFVTQNANAAQLDAIFWIETILQDDGSTRKQLQYTQTVTLNFNNIKWPHISVATLVKQ